MGYVEQTLMPNETILLKAKLHWAIFVFPAILIVLGALFVVLSFSNQENVGLSCFGWVILLLGLLYGAAAAGSFLTTEFALTDKRIIAKTGLLRRRSLEMVVTKVESVGVNQPVLGRLFNYGTIVVVGTGGTKEPFPNIVDPMELRKRINTQIATH